MWKFFPKLVIAPGMFRISLDKSSREAKKVPNTNDRVPSTSKSSRSKNKDTEVEDHHRNLLLSKNNKHMSSACNNFKLDSHDVISTVVCAVCRKCLNSVNHDVCSNNYVNGKKSRGRKHKANVSKNETQQKNQPEIKKSKKVGFIKILATPKPRKSRILLRWSPTGRLFDQNGKISDSSESKSQSDCSNGDYACTSNTMEPKNKRFPNSTSLLGRTKKIMETINISFDELLAMAFERRSPKPGLQSMTFGHISLGLDLTYAPSTITQQPSEGELDLLFEAMYDDYFGGQPSATGRSDVDELNSNAMVDGNTFVNPFAYSSTSAAASSSSQNVDPSNMHTFYQPYPHEFQWTKDHPLEQDVISKVVCVVCKKCLNSINHDVCLNNCVNGKKSRGRKHKVNVSKNETQQKNQPEIKKPKKVGFIKRLVTPKPRKPRFLLTWSPTGRLFDQDGKLVAPSNFESHVDCSNGDNACTSNTLEPKNKRFPNFTSLLGRVYFVEGLGHNLFSVGQFCDSDLEVAFRRNASFVRNLEGVDLLKGDRSTNLHTINLHEMASASPICLMARASSTKSWLWHQRLSHLNFNTINDLARNDLVAGLLKFKYHKEHLCPSCEQGKSKRASHSPKPVPNLRQRLHLLHMDLVDLVPNNQSSASIRTNQITNFQLHVTFKENVSSDTVNSSST
nr:retrovirus-related Pol polyprotein from transposon TNT 1-94 [Tanacetum cinerariifolium]